VARKKKSNFIYFILLEKKKEENKLRLKGSLRRVDTIKHTHTHTKKVYCNNEQITKKIFFSM